MTIKDMVLVGLATSIALATQQVESKLDTDVVVADVEPVEDGLGAPLNVLAYGTHKAKLTAHEPPSPVEETVGTPIDKSSEEPIV